MKPARPVTRRAAMLFYKRWHKAQKRRDIRQMEYLLEARFFRFWWAEFIQMRQAQPFWSTAKAAVERILTERGMIAPEPERPSERAMRMAEKIYGPRCKYCGHQADDPCTDCEGYTKHGPIIQGVCLPCREGRLELAAEQRRRRHEKPVS